MKKMTLLSIAVASLTCSLFLASCSKKMHQNMMAQQQAAPTPMAKDASMVPFTKMKREQLERSGVDLTQVQFYVDQKLILRRMSGSDRAMVKNGMVVRENSSNADEVVIPEMTPVLCDRVIGDSLMISFETQNNDIPFGALYGSNSYTILAGNWINGSADVQYNGQTYRVICGSCNNVAEVRLMIKETTSNKPMNANKTVVGRKLYK